MLIHQAGSVHVGEVARYTLTYTPAADQILPTPAELYVTVKNTSAVPLRAAYLHGPYSLYASCYPSTFDPNTKYDRDDSDGMPQYEPYLKAGGNWDAVITVPRRLRRMPQEPTSSDFENRESVTWVIEVISQVVFSSSAAVPFEVLVSRDGKSTDLLSGKLSASNLPPPAQLRDHWSSETRGYQISATKGVFSNSVSLLIDDTASLWNTPSIPLIAREPGRDKNSAESISGKLSSVNDSADGANASEPVGDQAKEKVHLVVLTHGLHSNLGADMLYLKESIDNAVRRAKEREKKDMSQYRRNGNSNSSHSSQRKYDETESSDDSEQVIVRGFPGNAARTERGIQYLGKRLAKYILLMTYPDQPYLPRKNPIPRYSHLGASKKAECRNSCTGRAGCEHHSYQITSISFIGHSLGGLVQTYAIAYIHKYSPHFFELIKPINFIALASPFLGLSNENPMYIRFALDLGLIGRSGQDLGLSWTAPKVRGGWGAIIGSKAEERGKPQEHSDPGSKPLLRILPCGAAHDVLLKFHRRTVYSNVVNDGIVPLRTSSLLFLDWRGLDPVEKTSRDNGLVGTMAEWGWAELTGANSKSPRTAFPATEMALDDNDMKSTATESDTVGSNNHVDVLAPEPRRFFKQPHQSGIERLKEPNTSEIAPQSSALGPLSSLLSIFRPKETKHSPGHIETKHSHGHRETKHSHGHKQAKIYKRSQTLGVDDILEEPSSRGTRLPGAIDSYEEDGFNTPPKTTFFESASDLLMPPLPSVDFIIDPASRPRTIFHDRIYHPGDIPPPKPVKRRTLAIGPQRTESSETAGLRSSTEPLHPINGSESGLKVEEKIARAYHRDLSWRKVLVRLEPDAHNNIVVRRMFTNAHGWPVIKHLVDNHFEYPMPVQSDDSLGQSMEKGTPSSAEMLNLDDELNDHVRQHESDFFESFDDLPQETEHR